MRLAGSHWTAIGMLVAALALHLQTAGSWHAVFAVSSVGELLLSISAVCTSLGARSVYAPEPSRVDAIKALGAK